MADPLSFLSPLSAARCAVRLQRLASHPALLITRDGTTTEAAVSDLTLLLVEDGLYRVEFRATCRPHGLLGGLGAKVFYLLSGRLVQSEAGTLVRLHARASRPATPKARAIRLLWYLVWGGTLIGLLIAAFLTRSVLIWRLAGGFALALGLFYGLLFLFYGQAVAALEVLLRQTMGLHSQQAEASIRDAVVRLERES